MDRWNGVIVSDHGDRVETGRGTIDILVEVVDAVGGRIPVLVDGGFRRGSDVYRALAIGTRAVGIGRPYIYGLASFGQEGVERVLDILRRGADSHDQPCAWMAASSAAAFNPVGQVPGMPP